MDITITPKPQYFTTGQLKFVKNTRFDEPVDDLRETLLPQIPEEIPT